MAKLLDYCTLVRSKNAGPFVLTFDLMFKDLDSLRYVRRSGVFTKAFIAETFAVAEEEVLLVYHEPALALKISIPRPVFQGELDDADCYGGQQYIPLMDVEIGQPVLLATV